MSSWNRPDPLTRDLIHLINARRHDHGDADAAVETLQGLMVTLAHHLLNAVQVIGGLAGYCLKREKDDQVRGHLEVIKKEAHRIQTVVQILQEVEAVTVEPYVPGSEARILDIREELERRLCAEEVIGGALLTGVLGAASRRVCDGRGQFNSAALQVMNIRQR